MIKKINKFGASWCGPCKVLDATLNKVTEVEVNRFDVDDEGMDDVCANLNIRNIPVMIFLDENDNEVERTVGAVSLTEIQNIINKHGS